MGGEGGVACDGGIEPKEPREMDGAGGAATWKAASEAQSSEAEIGPSGESGIGVNRKDSLETRKASSVGEVGQEMRPCVGQSWDCSQLEDDLEERDSMDWLEDDEVMRQLEEVNKGEER